MEKVSALVEELRPHLRLLSRQAKRYEGRESIEQELKDLESKFYGHQLRVLETELSNLRAKEENLTETIQKEDGLLKGFRNALDQIRDSEPKSVDELRRLKREGEKLQQQRAEIQIELGKAEVRLELISGRPDLDPARVRKAMGDIKRLSQAVLNSDDLKQIRQNLTGIMALVDSLDSSVRVGSNETLNKTRQDLQDRLGKISRLLEDLTGKEEKLRESLENFNSEFTRAYEKVETQQKKFGDLYNRRNDLLIKKERLQANLESLLGELRQIGRSRESLPANPEESGLSEGEARQKMLKLRSHLASIGEIDESVLKEAQEAEQRYQFLVSQTDDLKKAMNDLTMLVKELEKKIHNEFSAAMEKINDEFTKLIKIVFGSGSRASLRLQKTILPRQSSESEKEGEDYLPEIGEKGEAEVAGIEIGITLPKKRIRGLEVLSGGERALVSIAALFALVSVSAPPFLFLDEVDAALDERNARRFGEILRDFSKKTQFVIVTHNRATMEAADVLYGVTMFKDGSSKLVSLKLT